MIFIIEAYSDFNPSNTHNMEKGRKKINHNLVLQRAKIFNSLSQRNNVSNLLE